LVDTTTRTGGIAMSESNDSTASKGLRAWWATPPRTGMRRLIIPWEYRRARPFGILRIVGGLVQVTAGFICLSYTVYGWAAFFLVLGALNLGGGIWFLTIDRDERGQRRDGGCSMTPA
jgi:hypothetical protein